MSNIEFYIFIGISFIVGALLGYLICLFTNRKKDKSRMEDELTRAKRELYNQKRMLADFFSTSNTLFEQLENSYQAYSSHMNEHARKMFPMLGNMYVTSKHLEPSKSIDSQPKDVVTPLHEHEIDDMYANEDPASHVASAQEK